MGKINIYGINNYLIYLNTYINYFKYLIPIPMKSLILSI